MEKEKTFKFTVVFTPEEEGGYSASVPVLPGCFSYGESFEKAKINIREAIQCHIESLLLDNEEIPTEDELISSTIVLKEKVKV